MFNSFVAAAGQPDTSVYDALQPETDINARNQTGAYGQNMMEHMDLKVADAVPDRLFNEIIWKSIRGDGHARTEVHGIVGGKIRGSRRTTKR